MLASSRLFHHHCPLQGVTQRCKRPCKCGTQAGISAKLKANTYRPAIPSILLSNIHSLENKMDYLSLDLTTQNKASDCCTLIFTETWLNFVIHNSMISMDGLTTFFADRSYDLSSKSWGGGVCIYINNKWCTNAEFVSSHCSPDKVPDAKMLTILCGKGIHSH